MPAGFTSSGLPIGVQLMGPANSEPLLISLAAALEAINGWSNKQPQAWWTQETAPDPQPTGPHDHSIEEITPGEVA